MVSQLVVKESCRVSKKRDGVTSLYGAVIDYREGPCRARITVMEIRMMLAWLGEKSPKRKGLPENRTASRATGLR